MALPSSSSNPHTSIHSLQVLFSLNLPHQIPPLYITSLLKELKGSNTLSHTGTHKFSGTHNSPTLSYLTNYLMMHSSKQMPIMALRIRDKVYLLPMHDDVRTWGDGTLLHFVLHDESLVLMTLVVM